MITEFSCACCGSSAITYTPAFLSKFVIWRTSGQKPITNKSISLGHCEICNYRFSSARFTDDEIVNLYKGYRDKMYNQMRLECEPNYVVDMYSDDYVNNRKKFINDIIFNNTDNIKSILDYGGDDGKYIPDVETRYVYDLSDVNPINGIKKYSTSENIKFDLVMNCQVLEHVSDINRLITTLKSLTNQYLYIEVPAYNQPPPINMTVGEHINFFRKSSLHALLNKHKINIVDTAVDYDLQVLAVLGKI